MRRRHLAACAVALLLVAACGGDDDGGPTADPANPTSTTAGSDGTSAPAAGSLAGVRVSATEIATADVPIKLVARPGSDLLYVAERGGTVRTLEVDRDGEGRLGDEPVLDLSEETTTESERGLLGIAFSEDGDELYASYTNRDGDTRLDAYAMDGEVAEPGSRRRLLAVDQPFPNHNGGNVVRGPDGDLWLGLGDGGSGGDPDDHAQDPDDPLGKLLRIDPTDGGEPEIWAMGLRNPWRFSFDRETDDLWIGDVGQDAVEEIDVAPAGTEAGTNFGWSGYEGSTVYDPERVPEGAVGPVFEASHGDGWCSITGGVVYRGERIPDLQGAYLFGDYCRTGLHALVLEDGAVTAQRELGVEVASLVSIDEDADGEIYLLSLDGSILRLDPA